MSSDIRFLNAARSASSTSAPYPPTLQWYTNTTRVMGRNAIQFQKGLSMPEFQKLSGTKAQCEKPWLRSVGLTASVAHAAKGSFMGWCKAAG